MKNRKIYYPLIAAVSAAALYLIYYALFGFYPFGERSIAWCDMEQQYLPLLMELRNALRGDGSLLLGQGGAGMSFWGVYLFFVSSPIGFISAFIPQSEMLHLLNILTVLKAALAGASAEFFLVRKFPKLRAAHGIILSMMYAFSGYVMMYYQNNMWLDMMILLPILVLSMIRLAEDGKMIGFTICLALSMYLNFYISFMLIIFSVIFFAMLLKTCCKPEKRGLHAIRFILADICAAMISAIVWLPVVHQLSHSGRSGSTLELFLSGIFISHIGDKAALLSCTGIVWTAAVMIFTHREIFRKGLNACFGTMTVVLLVSTVISPINKLWHTGSYQAYPLRYGFILIFMCLCAVAALLSEHKSEHAAPAKQLRISLTVSFIVTAAAMAIALTMRKRLASYAHSLWVEDDDAAVLTAIGVLFALTYGLLIACKRGKVFPERITSLIMGALMIGESLLSFGVYVSDVNDITPRFLMTKWFAHESYEDGFYRLKSNGTHYYSNFPEGMGFASLGHYTSLTDGDWLFGAKRLGYSAYWMDVSSSGGTAVTDAFLLNRYITGTEYDMNGNCKELNLIRDFKHFIEVYRNLIVSEGAVISDTPPNETEKASEVQRMDSSVLLAEKLYGAENIIEEHPFTKLVNCEIKHSGKKIIVSKLDPSKPAEMSVLVETSGAQEVYFDLFGNYSTALREDYFSSVDIYLNGNCKETEYPEKRINGIYDLGTFIDKKVKVTIKLRNDFTAESFGVYTLDTEKLAEAVNSTPTAKITAKSNKLTLTGYAHKGQWLYIPFAYNTGFSAVVNGKKADISRGFGEFMAVELSEGKNDIILTFVPEGFKAGAVICVLGLVLMLMLGLTARFIKPGKKLLAAAEKTVFAAGIAIPLLMGIGGTLGWIIGNIVQ